MQQTFPSWVNGKVQSELAITDRAIAYGDGVFETLRSHPQLVLADYHFDRLSSGLSRLKIPFTIMDIRNAAIAYADQYRPGLIKIIVSRGSGGRGYLAPDNPEPVVIIQGFELPSYPTTHYQQGIDIYLCKTPLVVNPVLQGCKHLNRLEQVIARNEFSSTRYHEGLMANLEGYWVEGTISNLFFAKNGQVYTPTLDQCAVKGTMQRFILESCVADIGEVVEKEKVDLATLTSADEVFVCNSVFGVWPVRTIMDQAVGPDNRIVQIVQDKVQTLIS